MLTLATLKLISDLTLYYSLAGFFAMLFGDTRGAALLTVCAVQVLSGVLCCALRKRRRLCFFPLLLLVVAMLFCGSIAAAVVAVPAAIYTIWLVAKEMYFPDQGRQTDIFSAAWKILLGFVVLMLLLGCAELLSAITIPAGVIALVCCVLQNRSLRHDPAVYCSARFQAVNLGFAAGVCVVGAALSSNVFLHGCVTVLQWIYMHLILPILDGLLYLLSLLAQFLRWAFSWMRYLFFGREMEFTELEEEEADEILEEAAESSGHSGLWAGRIAWAIVAVAVAVLIILFFRWLARRPDRKKRSAPDAEITRSAVARGSTRSRSPLSRSPVDRVRAQYRRFLKTYRSSGLPLGMGDTSLDVSRRAEGRFDPEATERLRTLYLAARYADRAEETDAAEARDLVQKLKRYEED